MKFIHMADLHLGHSFYGSDRIREHRHFLGWLMERIREHRPDALLVSGDVFDNSNPSAAADRLLWEFLNDLTREHPLMRVIVTSGNHDSAARLEAPMPLYNRIGVQVRGRIPRDDRGRPVYDDLAIPISAIGNDDDQTVVLAVPYLRSDDYPAAESEGESVATLVGQLLHDTAKRFKGLPIILMAHVFATGASFSNTDGSGDFVVGGLMGVDASPWAKGAAYTALGHIHRAQAVGGNPTIRYSGSALPMSFTERGYRHGVELVELLPDGTVSNLHLEYEPLRPLMTLPAQGAASFSQVMAMLEDLDKAKDSDDPETYPYLEIKVSEAQPNPDMIHSLQNEAEKHRVRLCRIERVCPKREGGEEQTAATPEQLERLTPAFIARQIYEEVYQEEMSDELARLVAQVKREAEEQE